MFERRERLNGAAELLFLSLGKLEGGLFL
jgi:hypothetical protein